MMINLYLCEDDPKQLNQLQQLVTTAIVTHQLEMQLGLATQNPTELLQEIQAHRPQQALYLLDISLKAEINGIELAAKLRAQDAQSKIVFITTHSELSLLVFKYQIEALDFIIKDAPEALAPRLERVLQVAQDRFNAAATDVNDYIQLKVGQSLRSINVAKVLFFESSANAHKLILHLDDGQVEFYGLLKDVPALNSNFYKCHKSYVVNLDKITALNKAMRTLTLTDGETILCSLTASRYLAKKGLG